NRDFTTEVEVGDYIVWQGKPKDSGRKNDTVIITSIIHQAGPNFFPQDTLEGDNQGRVPGYIDSGKEQEVSKYNLQFEVINNGVKINETFVIDPKIRIKKR
ncbi:MAG: hypothetical protein KJO29_12555, partial [Bacteroidia bacterium]|nr:hypothetical protein [Bacteroidia bacterium]